MGILYGLPKTHKAGNPIRSIFSIINTFSYKLAKYFIPILEPLTSNRFTLKNSHDFVKEINKLEVNNTVMASFDVKSLFTDIPLDETIEIICNELSKEHNTYSNYTKNNLLIKNTSFV